MISSAEVQAFVADVRSRHDAGLRNRGSALVNGHLLVDRFEALAAAPTWDAKRLLALHEIVNEICVASELLRTKPASSILHYETALNRTQLTIDFMILESDGTRRYFDVKTVDPQWQDSPQAEARYQRSLQHVPDNIDLVAQGSTYGQMQTSRARFLEYSVELEEKVAAFAPTEAGSVTMIFCGDGFAWHASELEDFADFYRSGRHRQDDPFSGMEKHYISSEGIVLRRSIASFAFLLRPKTHVEPTEVCGQVRGPTHFS